VSDPAGRGRVVGQGRFRVDRRRALEKMERFQLEDPHRYVLEWVAAGVVAGAERIDVVNDADDLEIHWACPGGAPSGSDLDQLFDHLWGSPDVPREAMLQHLGLGVLGALGLSPRWVHVDSGTDGGDIRLAVTDPTDTRHAALGTDEVDGVRCHVREQLTTTTVREALTAMFQEPTEARLIQGAARWAPVTINGRRVAPPEPPTTATLDVTGPTGRLWFAIHPALPVDVIRHGVVVGHVEVRLGPFAVGGWWQADDVRLNASRSKVVEDERWRRVEATIHDAVDRILRHELGPALAASDARELVWHGEGDRARVRFRATHDELLRRLAAAGIHRLLERRRSLGKLDRVPALADVHGVHHSVDDLKRAKGDVGTASRAFDDPDFGRIVFTGQAADVVRTVLPKAPDWTRELEERAEGRRRRAEAERTREAPVFRGADPQRTLREGPLALAVRCRPGRIGRDATILVHVRIDGVPLCTTEVGGPAGRLEAIVDHPEIAADAAFREVRHTPVFTAALARLRLEAHELLLDLLSAAVRAPTDADVQLLTELLARASADLGEAVRAADPRLRTLALLRTGTGRWVDLEAALSRRWWVASSLPPGCPAAVAEDVLLVPDQVRLRWDRWLGHELGSEAALAARIERERRLAAPRRRAELTARLLVQVPVAAPGLRGAVGRSGAAQFTDAAITVLRDGVEVCTVRWELALHGVVGIVDGPDLEVTPAHDALTSEGRAAVRQAIEPAVDQLALALWRALPPGAAIPEPLLDWLRAREARAPVGPLIVARRIDGRDVSVSDLRGVARKKAKAKAKAKLRVTRADPAEVPGFDDALLHTPALERLLNVLVPGAWRDATNDVIEARGALTSFMTRPQWTEPPSLARRPVADPGERWSGVALLPVGEACGQATITALWRGRVLTTWPGGGAGPSLVVRGAALEPNRQFDGLADRNALIRLQGLAGGWLEGLLDDGLARSTSLVDADVSWLALVTRLADDSNAVKRAMAQRIEQRPILRRVGGPPASLRDVRASARARHVSPETVDGPVDDTLYVCRVPGLEAALQALYGLELLPGDRELETWRRGHARRSQLRRREAVVTSPLWVARSPLAGGGEVALLGDAAPPGLQIEPLVDGRPLAPKVLPLPVAAVAVVEGAGVTADPAFEQVVVDAAWQRRVREVRGAVEGMVHRRLRSIGSGHREPLGWAWAWLLAEGERTADDELDALAFPLVDHTHATLRELLARQRRDGALAVSSVAQRVPRGPQPILVTEGLRSLLADRFELVDIKGPRPRPHVGPITPPPPRRGALAVGPGGIEIRVDGQPVLHFQPPTGPMALEGWIDDPSLTPNALWNDVARDARWGALLAWITAAYRDRLVEEATRPNPPPVLLETLIALTSPLRSPPTAPEPDDPVLRALYAAPLLPDSAGGRVSLASLLAAGTPVRRVPAGNRGEALAGRPPFVAVDDPVRDWLARIVAVREARSELAAETLGAERRRRARWSKPRAPSHAATWRGPAEVVLWLAAVGAPPPQVLDDGRLVCLLGFSSGVVPGLTGWVDGRFETDDPYTTAVIPPEIEAEITSMTAALLQAEAYGGPGGRTAVCERLKAAFGKGKLQDLAQQPVWRELALFQDVAGEPVRLQALVQAAKRRRRVLWDAPGTAMEADEVVVAASELDRVLLGGLLPGVAIERRGSRARRQELEQASKAQDAAARAEAEEARGRRRALIDAVRSVSRLGADEVDAWLAWNPGPPPDAGQRLLAAWEIASAELGGAEAELDVIVAVAERLRT
jgi:hypothetical protein